MYIYNMKEIKNDVNNNDNTIQNSIVCLSIQILYIIIIRQI